MAISVFEMFSIGIGPSSSHTVGPMRAANEFINQLSVPLAQVYRVEVTFYGSLAYTGRPHGTHTAILMGLLGEMPEHIDPETIPQREDEIERWQHLKLMGQHDIEFVISRDIIHDYKKTFDFHSNAMQFIAFDKHREVLHQDVYFSIGGGFIVNQEQASTHNEAEPVHIVPYPFHTAADLLNFCKTEKISIAEVMMANELALVEHQKTKTEIKQQLLHIADVMLDSIERGCQTEGELPGGLHVMRRAPALYQKLHKLGPPSMQHPERMNWLNMYGLAVNEENAAGHRIVTAPTNGGAGIVPALLKFYCTFYPDSNEDGIVEYLLTAGAIGILYKQNAAISGAEMGCQGEVGVASSMAAGGIAAARGGTLTQIANAAEIAMEHNLGLTCDPVGGLVQIPCIERNAMGAVKAYNAAQLALAEDRAGKVSLDMVINTMREIGVNMNNIYKETSKGGLAVNVPQC